MATKPKSTKPVRTSPRPRVSASPRPSVPRARAAKRNAVVAQPPSAVTDAAAKMVEVLKPFDLGRATLKLVPPKDIIPSPDNVRHFDPKDPEDAQFLAEIAAQGVLVPLHVRTHPKHTGKYDLRAGERRHAAALLAGLPTVPVLDFDGLDDRQAYIITAIENSGRKDLSPFQDADRVLKLMEYEGGSVERVARILSWPQHKVVARARLKSLIPDWRKSWQENPGYTIRHMEIIARLDPAQQKQLFTSVDDGELVDYNGGICSTRDLQRLIDEDLLHHLSAAVWDLDDATLDKAAGSCSECPQRSSRRGLLFSDDDAPVAAKKDQCLDPACWDRKRSAALPLRIEAARAKNPGALLVLDDNRDEEAQKAFPGALKSGAYYLAGNGDKSAKAAVVVNGPHAGEVLKIKTHDGRSESSGSSRASGRRAAGSSMSLPERRAQLDKKRWHEVLKLLRSAIAKVEFTALPTRANADLEGRRYHVLALAAVFGTNHRNEAPGPFEGALLAGQEKKQVWQQKHQEIDPWALLDKWEEGPVDAIVAALWLSVRAVLAKRITRLPSAPITQTPDDMIADAKHIAALCGIDIEALRAKAAEVYKEPRNWKSLPGYTPDPADAKTRRHGDAEKFEQAGDVSARFPGKPPRTDIVIGVNSVNPKTYALFDGVSHKRIEPKTYATRSTLGESIKDLRDYASANGFKIVSTKAGAA